VISLGLKPVTFGVPQPTTLPCVPTGRRGTQRDSNSDPSVVQPVANCYPSSLNTTHTHTHARARTHIYVLIIQQARCEDLTPITRMCRHYSARLINISEETAPCIFSVYDPVNWLPCNGDCGNDHQVTLRHIPEHGILIYTGQPNHKTFADHKLGYTIPSMLSAT
jgi:hypothetical protein